MDVESSLVICGTNNVGGGNLKFCTTLPGVPIQLDASFAAYGAVSSVELHDDICYASTVEDFDCAVEHEGLWIYDFSNPQAPVRIGMLDTPGRAKAVAVAKGHAYVADGEAGVQIADVTNPQSPLWVCTLRPHDDCVVNAQPEIQGDRLYVADENWNTIHTYDIADPDHPVLIDEDAWNYLSASLCAAGGLLSTANLWAGMCALDLRAVSGVAGPETGGGTAGAGLAGLRTGSRSVTRKLLLVR